MINEHAHVTVERFGDRQDGYRRLRVYGGWMVTHINKACFPTTESSIFVPDAQHLWPTPVVVGEFE